MTDQQNQKDEYFEEVLKKLEELYNICGALTAQNKALKQENELLTDYITKIGVKIKTEVCAQRDWNDNRDLHFKCVDIDRACFYVSNPDSERADEFIQMIKDGILPPFRFESYCKHFSANLSAFSDRDMIDYKYRKEVGIK